MHDRGGLKSGVHASALTTLPPPPSMDIERLAPAASAAGAPLDAFDAVLRRLQHKPAVLPPPKLPFVVCEQRAPAFSPTSSASSSERELDSPPPSPAAHAAFAATRSRVVRVSFVAPRLFTTTPSHCSTY